MKRWASQRLLPRVFRPVLKMALRAAGVLLFCPVLACALETLPSMNFGTVMPDDSDLRLTQAVCLAVAAGARGNAPSYQLQITGTFDKNGEFRLSNGPDYIHYAVRWSKNANASFHTVRAGARYTLSPAPQLTSCAASSQSDWPRLQLVIKSQWLRHPIAHSGDYHDSLLITLSPT